MTSSLVQQKWISSARPASSASGAMAASRFLRKYSTALTSCWVTRSVAAISSISAAPKPRTTSRRASCSSAVSRRTPGHDLVLGEVDQPLDLDVHPRPVERGLGEVVDEWGHDAAVAPVEGTEGDRGLGVGEAGGCREAGRAVGAGHAPILPERQGCGCRVATCRSLSPGRGPRARRGRARRSPGSRR